MECAGGVCAADGEFFLFKDGACVEAFVHFDDGDACGFVAVEYGGLDAGGASVFWEE